MRTYTIMPESGFHVLGKSDRSEAATMVLDAGETTGGADNRHSGSDQWLYVLQGSGEATVGDASVGLTPGMLLLIEAGETHQVSASPDGPLLTLNFYAPPAY
ncbi:cupin domain-containing protein [Thiohalomonas denitrificans]|uniref:cupin domain-containing protein n=1 Tax=Thiohalomonas denitrificans TaxID=415747 RepID=UPI0026F2E188|nr:cupin domain-containing protein [Thiohalomonas denitrificans]